MKNILFILLFFFLGILHANELNGSFFGDVEPLKNSNNRRIKASRGDFIFSANEYSFFHSLEWSKLHNRNIPIMFTENDIYNESGQWSIRKQGELNYLYLESDSGFTYKKELGILYHPRRMYLFENDVLYFFSNEGLRFDGSMPTVKKVYTSTFLTENENQYNGSYFEYPHAGKLTPWVEGIEGHGIGEWIEIDTESPALPVSFFLISNGYVSFEKPYLYEYNSRVKRFRITCEELDIDFEAELADTPDFQEIRLPKIITEKNATFRFTILDVYEGSKWADTCVNLIIPLGDLPE